MFNDDQRDYMRHLATIPVEELSWCGWYRVGEDPHPECKGKGTRADFLAAACSGCRTLPPHHVITCSRRTLP